LKIYWTDYSESESKSERFKSPDQIQRYISVLIADEKELGHLGASLDSLICKDGLKYSAFLYKGPKVDMASQMNPGSGAKDMGELVKRAKKANKILEDSGHPFSAQEILFSYHADSLSYESISKEGELSVLDSIVLLGDEVLDQKVLYAHLRLKKEQLYNEQNLSKVDARLKRLQFIRLVRPSELIYTKDRFRLLLSIEKKKANTANGIIGFQPDENGKVRITGELDLVLQNALNRADRISLNWRRLQDASQKLEASFAYPYLFRTALGMMASLDQFRQDSTFNQVSSEFGLSYLLENGDILEAEIGRRTFSNLLDQPSTSDITDSRSLMYGIGYLHNSLDDQFNPYHGMRATLRVSYGTKTLTTASQTEDPVVNELDSWEVYGDIRRFIPIIGRSTLMFRLNAFHQESDVILFKELQRIGGLFTLRGTDELAIRASTYGIWTTEFRFLTDERAYVSAFFDMAYYEAKTPTYREKDSPYGFGLGTAFDTGAGIFTLNYALGSRFDTSPSFRSAKIHFGYTALF